MKKLIAAAVAVFLSGAVFTSVTSLIWPGRDYPVWAQRVSSIVFLAGLLVLGAVAWRAWREKS